MFYIPLTLVSVFLSQMLPVKVKIRLVLLLLFIEFIPRSLKKNVLWPTPSYYNTDILYSWVLIAFVKNTETGLYESRHESHTHTSQRLNDNGYLKEAIYHTKGVL